MRKACAHFQERTLVVLLLFVETVDGYVIRKIGHTAMREEHVTVELNLERNLIVIIGSKDLQIANPRFLHHIVHQCSAINEGNIESFAHSEYDITIFVAPAG